MTPVTDWPGIITALATLLLAWSQVRTRGAVKQTASIVDKTHQAQSDMAASIGPANGETLHQLAAQVIQLDGYTHDSVHDLKGKVEVVTALAPQLLDRLHDHSTKLDVLTAKIDALK